MTADDSGRAPTTPGHPTTPGDPIADRLYRLRDSSVLRREDPHGDEPGGHDPRGDDPSAAEQINRLMAALAELRRAEKDVLEASERYMRLGAQDMRALHYLIAAQDVAGAAGVVTPSMVSAHLGISAASTTKLLNRLERAGHITRSIHPADRRAFALTITPETEAAARATIGRQHAGRARAAARLSPDEREVVIRFLHDMTAEVADTDWP